MHKYPPRPTRTVQIVDLLDDVWTVRLTSGSDVSLYEVSRGLVNDRYTVWLWRQIFTDLPEVCSSTAFAVDVDNHFGDSCTCLGHDHYGHCGHIDAMKELLARGELPAFPDTLAS